MNFNMDFFIFCSISALKASVENRKELIGKTNQKRKRQRRSGKQVLIDDGKKRKRGVYKPLHLIVGLTAGTGTLGCGRSFGFLGMLYLSSCMGCW